MVNSKISKEKIQHLVELRREEIMAYERVLLEMDESRRGKLYGISERLTEKWKMAKEESFITKDLAVIYAWDLIEHFYYITIEKISEPLKVLGIEVAE